ncbi:biopolymer transporter ExbD [Candidatus Parabeggiatoa sp. HSG14]|uniref:ExbD/TolR family protein n=1 Tax=Candidatus Parabeggiatoa sp. HSG14 TaxID=3055593 RepID=UPI0025A8ABA3|nr:biopolymer transporter ExbD [Thiotrichales bacterium HSG14]
MKFRRSQSRDNLRVNLTPLIDTVFLLLIFFMMTTTFNKESQLNIDLPQAKGETVEQQEIIRIIVDADGKYAINDSEHGLVNNQLETLKRALKDAVGDQTNPPLLISADKNSPHYAVVKAMEAARDLGFVRLSFEAQQSEK